ncbi:MAG: DegT/DnrJ/EryC1/StrS family aminotransferase [Methanobacterium sp. ERen5]|nr:MAG: DegT/DnrJ/EryC1/StrS family aminotransferase [Methanobacterium sp. ERen5]
MELSYRRPSAKTRNAMCKAAQNLKHVKGEDDEITFAENAIGKLTQHKRVQVLNSGNSAIMAVMSCFKNRVMIPDQGAWYGFRKIAEFFGIEAVKVPTDLGLIDLEKLDENIKQNNPEALFLTSFAGYTAEQPIKAIYEICDENGVMLVEDASGGIGDPKGRLGNGNHAHVIVGSTGSPKTVNVGNGGFVSSNQPEIFDTAKYLIKILKADPVTCAGIYSEAGNAEEIFEKTTAATKKLKNDVSNFREVIHPTSRGLNIILPDRNQKLLGSEIRKKLNVPGGSIVSLSPNYNRIKARAVCIELKNLDVKCLTPENLDEISDIIKFAGKTDSSIEF